MRIPVDRARRQSELQAAELLVQLAAACQQEITVLGGDAGGLGQAGLRESWNGSKPARSHGQPPSRVECGQQPGQVGMGGRRLAARDRVPERDRVAVHQQRLIDLVVDADCGDVRGWLATGRRTVLCCTRRIRSADRAIRTTIGAPASWKIAFSPRRSSSAPSLLSPACAQAAPERRKHGGRRELRSGIRHGVQDSRHRGLRSRARYEGDRRTCPAAVACLCSLRCPMLRAGAHARYPWPGGVR